MLPFLLLLLGLGLPGERRGAPLLWDGPPGAWGLVGVFALFFLPMGLAHYVVAIGWEAAFHPGILWEGINGVLAEYVASFLSASASISRRPDSAIPMSGRSLGRFWASTFC